MSDILECKHETSEVIHAIMNCAYICRCTSHCGQIFLENEYNDRHVILSPDWSLVEQRDELAKQVETLALENQRLKQSLDDRIFEIMANHKWLHLSFNYGDRMIAAFDFDGDIVDECASLETLLGEGVSK